MSQFNRTPNGPVPSDFNPHTIYMSKLIIPLNFVLSSSRSSSQIIFTAMDIDGLLCDENLALRTPTGTPPSSHDGGVKPPPLVRDAKVEETPQNDDSSTTLYQVSKEENEEVLALFLDKEVAYMLQPGYVELLRSKDLLVPRFKAVQWLVKAGLRLSLETGTTFNAINYLDRFFSTTQCQEWKHVMHELLPVTCLVIATKFSETNPPSNHDIQLEGLEYLFQPATILRMESIVLETLGWKLDTVTPQSFVEPFINKNIDHLQSLLDFGLVERIEDKLLSATLQVELVEHRPSVVTGAAILCLLEEFSSLYSEGPPSPHIMNMFNPEQQVSVEECCRMVAAAASRGWHSWWAEGSDPSAAGRVDVKDNLVDLSPLEHGLNKNNPSSKRRRHLDDDQPPTN